MRYPWDTDAAGSNDLTCCPRGRSPAERRGGRRIFLVDCSTALDCTRTSPRANHVCSWSEPWRPECRTLQAGPGRRRAAPDHRGPGSDRRDLRVHSVPGRDAAPSNRSAEAARAPRGHDHGDPTSPVPGRVGRPCSGHRVSVPLRAPRPVPGPPVRSPTAPPSLRVDRRSSLSALPPATSGHCWSFSFPNN
jgi:hypothetical protein